MNCLRRLTPLAVLLALSPVWAKVAAVPGEPPALTVILVVDQLTADRTREWAQKDSSSGFRRLWKGGVVYENAAYDHATSATAPGHATIATGVHPSKHGVISNFWYEREVGRPFPSVWDREHGVSPARLAAPTLADILHSGYQGRAKIFSVSIKDRGAVFTAGRNGKAFWYSTRSGGFVTNSFYYPEGAEPGWLSAYNDTAYRQVPAAWDLLLPGEAYAHEDDRRHERPPQGWTRFFPHEYAPAGTRQYYDQLRYAPDGDRITMGLAQVIIENESLGQDDVPDLLSVSLSATDRIGHAFGPDSRESEDNLHRLDRLLSEFLDYLDSRVGTGRFLLALSSDHGMRPIPEYAPGADPEATRVFSRRLTEALNRRLSSGLNATGAQDLRVVGALNRQLSSELDVDEDLVTGIVMPWAYFNLSAIERLELDLDSVRRMAGEWLEARPEIARTVPVSQLDDCGGDRTCELIRNVWFDGRSGEMYVVESQNSFVSADPPVYAASHGSPYLADLRVPVLFYGADLNAAIVDRPVTPRHIAPTLARALGLPPMEGWEKPLAEVTGRPGLPGREGVSPSRRSGRPPSQEEPQ